MRPTPFSSSTKKRQQFKSSIRRTQLDSFFEIHRQQLLKIQANLPLKQQLKSQLMNKNQRNVYLSEMQQKLRNRQVWQWEGIIEELTMTLNCFNGVFQAWVERGVIQQLGKAFRGQYSKSEMQGKIAKLLSNMIAFCKGIDIPTCEHLLDSPIPEDLILLFKNHSNPLPQQINFAMLLGYLCQISFKARNTVVQMGADEVLVDLGERMCAGERETEIEIEHEEWMVYLGSLEGLVKVYVGDEGEKHINPDSAVKIIPIVIQTISSPCPKSMLKSSLIILNSILKQQSTQIYLKLIAEFPTFYPTMLSIIRKQQASLKQKALNILNLVCIYHAKKSVKELKALRLEDQFYQLWNNSAANDNVKYICVSLLCNMVDNAEAAERLAKHQIFDKIVAFLNHGHLCIRKHSYSCLLAVLEHLPAIESQSIIKQYNIIPMAMYHLSHLNLNSTAITKSVLTLLKLYIVSFSAEGYNAGVEELQNKYGLVAILLEIYESSPICTYTSCEIVEMAGVLVDLMAEYTRKEIDEV